MFVVMLMMMMMVVMMVTIMMTVLMIMLWVLLFWAFFINNSLNPETVKNIASYTTTDKIIYIKKEFKLKPIISMPCPHDLVLLNMLRDSDSCLKF